MVSVGVAFTVNEWCRRRAVGGKGDANDRRASHPYSHMHTYTHALVLRETGQCPGTHSSAGNLGVRVGEKGED